MYVDEDDEDGGSRDGEGEGDEEEEDAVDETSGTERLIDIVDALSQVSKR